jgi:hypothetical protein
MLRFFGVSPHPLWGNLETGLNVEEMLKGIRKLPEAATAKLVREDRDHYHQDPIIDASVLVA